MAYKKCKIGGKMKYLHRVIFEESTGIKIPKGMEIDHVNHDRSDNRLSNLRLVFRGDNMKNKSKYSNNTSGVTGVTWDKSSNRWLAQIFVDGKRRHLGRFVEFSDAVNARKNAEVLYGFHTNHGR